MLSPFTPIIATAISLKIVDFGFMSQQLTFWLKYKIYPDNVPVATNNTFALATNFVTIYAF